MLCTLCLSQQCTTAFCLHNILACSYSKQQCIGQDLTQALTEAHWSRSHTGAHRSSLVKIPHRPSQKHIGQDPTQALTEAHWSRSHPGTHRSTLVKIPHRHSQKLIGQDPTQAFAEAHWSRSHTGTHRSSLVKIPHRHSQKLIGQDPTQALTEAHWSRSHTGTHRSTLVKIPHRHSQKNPAQALTYSPAQHVGKQPIAAPFILQHNIQRTLHQHFQKSCSSCQRTCWCKCCIFAVCAAGRRIRPTTSPWLNAQEKICALNMAVMKALAHMLMCKHARACSHMCGYPSSH